MTCVKVEDCEYVIVIEKRVQKDVAMAPLVAGVRHFSHRCNGYAHCLEVVQKGKKPTFFRFAMAPARCSPVLRKPLRPGLRPCSGSAHCLEVVQKGKKPTFLNNL